jgi:hypothetical protein
MPTRKNQTKPARRRRRRASPTPPPLAGLTLFELCVLLHGVCVQYALNGVKPPDYALVMSEARRRGLVDV